MYSSKEFKCTSGLTRSGLMFNGASVHCCTGPEVQSGPNAFMHRGPMLNEALLHARKGAKWLMRPYYIHT